MNTVAWREAEKEWAAKTTDERLAFCRIMIKLIQADVPVAKSAVSVCMEYMASEWLVQNYTYPI